jgi:hypothetical protein
MVYIDKRSIIRAAAIVRRLKEQRLEEDVARLRHRR